MISAPGKVFLFGEYAVLEGAPAVLAAVDRRVTAQIRPSAQWSVHAPDIGLQQFQIPPHAQAPKAIFDDPRLKVFCAVKQQVSEWAHTALPALHVNIDSQPFLQAGYKLGLGSSAAVAAVLTAGFIQQLNTPLPTKQQLLALAIAGHRRAQNGTGSGADVAASIYGQVIEYKNEVVLANRPWPEQLSILAIPTGQGASTTKLVAKVKAYKARQPQAYQKDLARLITLSGQASQALSDPTNSLELVDAYFQALIELGRNAKAGIVLPKHLELAHIVHSLGGAFKTTGAGGGDIGLAFTPTTQALALKKALHKKQIPTIALKFGVSGLTTIST